MTRTAKSRSKISKCIPKNVRDQFCRPEDYVDLMSFICVLESNGVKAKEFFRILANYNYNAATAIRHVTRSNAAGYDEIISESACVIRVIGQLADSEPIVKQVRRPFAAKVPIRGALPLTAGMTYDNSPGVRPVYLVIKGARVSCCRCGQDIVNPTFGKRYAEKNLSKLMCTKCFEKVTFGKILRPKDLIAPKKKAAHGKFVYRAQGQTLKDGSHRNNH